MLACAEARAALPVSEIAASSATTGFMSACPQSSPPQVVDAGGPSLAMRPDQGPHRVPDGVTRPCDLRQASLAPRRSEWAGTHPPFREGKTLTACWYAAAPVKKEFKASACGLRATFVAGSLLAALFVAAAGLAAWSPVPLSMWMSGPENALWLSLGENPHPARLRIPADRPLSAVAQLGKRLFHDERLSASGRMSCASCHNPAFAYGPVGSSPVVLGGPRESTPGVRAVPSLRYLYRQPPFTIGPDIETGNDTPVPLARQVRAAAGHPRLLKTAQAPQAAASNMVPQGGLFWDGRADTLEQQIDGPLFNAAEMDGGTVQAVAGKLASGPYAADFKRLFGPSVFQNARMAVDEAMFAIGRYEIEDPTFHPFTSKYDAWLEGKARFTRAQLAGYLLFNDPAKGNCAACHLDQPTPSGRPPLFTDHQFEALGVPRNPGIPANRDPHYYDLGICGPYRTDLRAETQYCGMFLTPTLRNVALRHVFFHNGVFHSLTQVLDFYADRDIHPGRFYPRDAAGRVIKYDDIPARYRGNVDTADAPLNRHPGDPPALTPAQIQEVIAFLETLTDGYTIQHSRAARQKGAGTEPPLDPAAAGGGAWGKKPRFLPQARWVGQEPRSSVS